MNSQDFDENEYNKTICNCDEYAESVVPTPYNKIKIGDVPLLKAEVVE